MLSEEPEEQLPKENGQKAMDRADRRLSRRERESRLLVKRSEDYDVFDNVFDVPTLMIINDLKDDGVIHQIRGSLAAGKESKVYTAIAPDGTLNVVFFDRSYDPANSRYGVTLARLAPRSSGFALARVDTGLSDPNHARWFSGATGGETTFLGDYNGLAIGSDGVAHPVWTDMRRIVTVAGRTGATEDIFTAAVP